MSDGEPRRAGGSAFVAVDLAARAAPQADGPAGRGAPLPALGAAGGFRRDSRYALSPRQEPEEPPPPEEPEPPAEDLVAKAYAEGFDAGVTEALAQAAQLAQANAEAREELKLSFARLDAEMEEDLRSRLLDTVAALCETAIAPLALDREQLVRRISRAVAMLSRADDERVIRLNPEDLVLVSPDLEKDWQVVPDPSLERGALRVECDTGGVADGPEVWRLAIAEALHRC